jgi:hypothetical protein
MNFRPLHYRAVVNRIDAEERSVSHGFDITIHP